MILAIASGKGGTGKTSVAVSLALAAAGAGRPVRLLDCDVEAPNAALFLPVEIAEFRDAGLLVPEVDMAACTLCGRCAEVCAYGAISVAGEQVLLFTELCHGCGSCARQCPTGAISERRRVIGAIESGRAGAIDFAQGRLTLGEAMATPIISQLKDWRLAAPPETLVILDAPPGAACPVIETLRGADFALLVTEPTPFGQHDLEQAARLARESLGLPTGVVVNRDHPGDDTVDAYCREADLPILARIPLDRRVAEAYAAGRPLHDALPDGPERFAALLARIEAEVPA